MVSCRVGVVKVCVAVSVGSREVYERVVVYEQRGVFGLGVFFGCLLEYLFFGLAVVCCVGYHAAGVLTAVYLYCVEPCVVGRPCYVGEVFVVGRACLEIAAFSVAGVVYAYFYFVALHACHRVFYRAEGGFAGVGVYQRVVFYGAFVHLVVCDVASAVAPEDALFYAELVAVYVVAAEFGFGLVGADCCFPLSVGGEEYDCVAAAYGVAVCGGVVYGGAVAAFEGVVPDYGFIRCVDMVYFAAVFYLQGYCTVFGCCGVLRYFFQRVAEKRVEFVEGYYGFSSFF